MGLLAAGSVAGAEGAEVFAGALAAAAAAAAAAAVAVDVAVAVAVAAAGKLVALTVSVAGPAAAYIEPVDVPEGVYIETGVVPAPAGAWAPWPAQFAGCRRVGLACMHSCFAVVELGKDGVAEPGSSLGDASGPANQAARGFRAAVRGVGRGTEYRCALAEKQKASRVGCAGRKGCSEGGVPSSHALEGYANLGEESQSACPPPRRRRRRPCPPCP